MLLPTDLICVCGCRWVWDVDRIRSDGLLWRLVRLMPRLSPALPPPPTPTSLCLTSSSIPRSSTRHWSLALCPTAARRKTYAPTTRTCTSTWGNITRRQWRTPSPTWRPGLFATAAACSDLHVSCRCCVAKSYNQEIYNYNASDKVRENLLKKNSFIHT